jgi:hypothetical protein
LREFCEIELPTSIESKGLPKLRFRLSILDTKKPWNAVESPSFDTTALLDLTILPKFSYTRFRSITTLLLAAVLSLAGCAHEEPILVEDVKYFDGDMPADFSGTWARDYSRGDDINKVLQNAYYDLARLGPRNAAGVPMASDRDMSMLVPLARLVEIITRTDELAISQNDYEILVERRDDYALMCAFFEGIAKPTESPFGMETCGWDGDQLISVNYFPDSLRVVHRFDTSEDRQELRVITTASSNTSRIPFTVTYYYRRFEKIRGSFECIETLSMKRVCSTGELAL